MSLSYQTFIGAEISEVLDDVARLRITVFRDFPYLYDGDIDYEASYLARYADTPSAIVVVASSEGQIVGAATGMAMEDADDDFATPLAHAGFNQKTVFYCAESVLLADWRGQGAGHAFFDAREQHALSLSRRWSVFASVVRPSDHPSRPSDYRPLDPFWRKRGYSPLDGAVAEFEWTDIGDPVQSRKPLQLWMKDLSA